MGDPWLGGVTHPPDLTLLCDVHTYENPLPFYVRVAVPQQQQTKPNQAKQFQPDIN